jgi:hypothetical protein
VDQLVPDLSAPWPDAGHLIRDLTLPACNGKLPGKEDCHARMVIDVATCSPQAPCDRLVVYWSGGEQSCNKGLYDGLLKNYAKDGFVAVCAQPYTTNTESGAYPFHMEWERMHELMQQIRQAPEVQAAWDGTKLLISGVSHGGTAPLVVIAANRALRDHAAEWTGSTHTAVILYDGISNPALLEEWAGKTQGCSLYHSRWVGRYGDGKPLIHSCINKACFCSTPPHKPDWEADTVVIGATSPKSPYTCQDLTPQSGTVLYRFVSCSGGTAKPCGALGDLIPDEQQKLPHDTMAGCTGITASYKQYPNCGHSLCGSQLCGRLESVAWLKTQGW